MNPDVLLNRIRLEQRGLIDIHKKLYEMEHLLPIPDPMQFAKTAESAALLSEKSTAHLRLSLRLNCCIAAISFSFCGSILLHISYPAVLNSDCSASFLVLVSFSCSLCFFFM